MPRRSYDSSDYGSGEEGSPDDGEESPDDSWDSQSSTGDEEVYADTGPKRYTHKRHHQSSQVDRARKIHKSQHTSQTKGVYVLRNMSTDTFYIGKSNDVNRRMEQHRQENDGEMLRQENNLTAGSTEDLESWERNEVLTRMYRHGMENVRGWRYTRRGPLTLDDKVSARNDIMEKFDLCRRCGRNNHFADKCFARTQAAWCKDIPW